MTTIAAPTVPRAFRSPGTHTENPHSFITARVVAVSTGSGTRTSATIELWQSTTDNALAKVFWDTFQTLEGCHPPPLSLDLRLVLLGLSRMRVGTGDLGFKERCVDNNTRDVPF